MRRQAILSLTTVWLIMGMVAAAPSRGVADPSPGRLKAVSVTPAGSSHEVVLRIEGDYTYHTPRATGDTVLVDLRGVRVAGVARDGKLDGGAVTDYHLLQYMDSSGQPVVRVQLNLKRPETLRVQREPAGLRLVLGSTSDSAAPTTTVKTLELPPTAPVAAQPRPVTAGPLRVSGVTITAGPHGETFVDIATTSPAPFKVLHLSDPARLVVDLEGARNAARKVYPARSAFLKGVRVGQFRAEEPSIVRVVADLAGEPLFDVHATAGGVRVELKPKSSAKVAAALAPVAAIEPKAVAKPIEKVQIPRPEEILTVKEAPAPGAAAEAKKEDVAAAAAVAAERTAPSPIEIQNTLPAPAISPEVAAAAKPQPAPLQSLEAIQAARAALTMANHPGMVMAMPQEPEAAPGREQPQYTGEPISLNLKDVDVKDFFRLIHEISGLNIIVDPNVTGNVTLVLDAVPWDQALDIVLKNNRLGKTLEGNVLRIARVETLTAEQEAAAKLAAAREEALPLVTVFRPVNYAKASTISTMLKSWVGGGALSKRGNVLVDERTNTLIISDIQTQIPIIESIISRLDKKAKQVQIEARIVRASADFSRSLGVSLNLFLQNSSGRTLGGAATGTASAAGTSVPGGDITLTPAKGSGFGALAITNAGANYFINAAIAAAETKAIAKTISKPTIVTQNNVPGTVTQGAQVPVQTTINNTVTTTYVNAALTLRVTPQVTEDGNVFLDITVNNSTPGAIIPGVNPVINTQQATTQVLVPDGGTVIFGGVNLTTRSKSSTQVPLLGSIPVLGNLFKSTTIQDSDQELLFFVSPKVLPG